jgi:hypothetical protein
MIMVVAPHRGARTRTVRDTARDTARDTEIA